MIQFVLKLPAARFRYMKWTDIESVNTTGPELGMRVVLTSKSINRKKKVITISDNSKLRHEFAVPLPP